MKFIWLIPLWLVLELVGWWAAAQWVGGWLVFWWTLVAVFIGLGVVKNSVSGLLPSMLGGAVNPAALGTIGAGGRGGNLGRALAGILIALPGLVSDGLGLLLLLPPVQRRVQAMVQRVMLKHQDQIMQDAMRRMGGLGGMGGAGGLDPRMMEEMMRQMGARGAGRPDVVDGEARSVRPQPPRITRQK